MTSDAKERTGSAGRPPGTWTRRREWRYLPVAAMVLVAGLGYAFGWHRYVSLESLAEHYDRLRTVVDDNYGLSLILFVGIYIALVAFSLPAGAVATMAGGILFGWWAGGTASVLAATIGAALVFLAVKTSLGALLAERAGPWLGRLKQGFAENALSYMLFLRLVPAFPFVVVNIAPALLGVSFRTYLIGTLFGILPGTYVYAYLGASLGTVIEAQHQSHLACLATKASNPALDCTIGIDTSALPKTELSIAFLLLAVAAILPVLLKHWWSSRQASRDL
ncbi:MAG: TVP38/TMEM64 family protein [Hyphomicrobiaceae bacterium]